MVANFLQRLDLIGAIENLDLFAVLFSRFRSIIFFRGFVIFLRWGNTTGSIHFLDEELAIRSSMKIGQLLRHNDLLLNIEILAWQSAH